MIWVRKGRDDEGERWLSGEEMGGVEDRCLRVLDIRFLDCEMGAWGLVEGRACVLVKAKGVRIGRRRGVCVCGIDPIVKYDVVERWSIPHACNPFPHRAS